MAVDSNRGYFVRLLALMCVLILGGVVGVNYVIESGTFPKGVEDWKAVLEANMKTGSMLRRSSVVERDSLRDPDEFVVPILRQGRQLFVQVELDDFREATLLIDTGATETILSTEVALDLGVLDDDAREVMYQTAGGEVQAFVTTLDSIRVGEAEVHDVVVAVQNIPGVAFGDGLLGMSFFEHFIVNVDSTANRLYLRPR